MTATHRNGRQLSNASEPLLRHIRELALEELVRALHAGAKTNTLRPIAQLVVQVDARLEKLTDRRLSADEPSVGRRQRIAGEALTPAPDAMGPRRARSSEKRTTSRGKDPRLAA